jgi:rubrerythrin
MNQSKKTELIRNQIAIAQTALDAAFLLLETENQEHCQPDDPSSHPEEYRENFSTMGVARWRCKLCGYLHEEPGGEVIKNDS